MGTAAQQIQQAIYTILSQDGPLLGLVTSIYDEVPEDRVFPYLLLGDVTETPLDTFGKRGRVAVVTITIYSTQKGFKESLLIANRVDNLLDQNSFPLSSYYMVYMLYKMLSTTRMSDGLTRKVDLKYDVFAEEK